MRRVSWRGRRDHTSLLKSLLSCLTSSACFQNSWLIFGRAFRMTFGKMVSPKIAPTSPAAAQRTICQHSTRIPGVLYLDGAHCRAQWLLTLHATAPLWGRSVAEAQQQLQSLGAWSSSQNLCFRSYSGNWEGANLGDVDALRRRNCSPDSGSKYAHSLTQSQWQNGVIPAVEEVRVLSP